MGEAPELCVVDDMAGLLARLPMTIRARHIVPVEVASEARDPETRGFLEWALEAGLVELAEPGSTGEPAGLPERLRARLSRADLAVLRAALEARGRCARVAVATDDYALQEAAALLGLDVITVRYPGSRVVRRWRASRRRGGGSSRS